MNLDSASIKLAIQTPHHAYTCDNQTLDLEDEEIVDPQQYQAGYEGTTANERFITNSFRGKEDVTA
jgi:hypothetical protein